MARAYEVVGIVGTRGWKRRDLVNLEVEKLDRSCMVISGGAVGVDTWAIDKAKSLGMKTEVIEPDFSKYGRPQAYFIRNTKIIMRSDRLIAFWDGESHGTRDAIWKAQLTGLNVYVHTTESGVMQLEKLQNVEVSVIN